MMAKDKEQTEEKEDKGQEQAPEQQEEVNSKENGQEANDDDPQDGELSETEKLRKQVNELNDKYLRLYSEFDNYKKRTIREKVDFGKRANTEVMEALLPILDDFQRAVNSMKEAEDVKSVEEGVELIHHKLKNNLKQKGLEPMESAKGKNFDPELHEAVTNIPAPSEDMKGKVVDEIERGYYLNGNVLRYAKVVVGN